MLCNGCRFFSALWVECCALFFWIRNWSLILLILFMLLLFFLLWKTFLLIPDLTWDVKSDLELAGISFTKICINCIRSDLRCQVGSGISRNFLHENMHQLTESDFLFEITFSRWWPWHFLQKSGAIWWVHRNRLPGKYAAASGSSWAKVDSYLLELFVLYHVISSHHIM